MVNSIVLKRRVDVANAPSEHTLSLQKKPLIVVTFV